MSRKIFALVSIALLPLVSGCDWFNLSQIQSEVQKAVAKVPALSCTLKSATPVVVSGVTTDLAIAIAGGVGPYTLRVVDRSIDVTPNFSIGHVFMNESGLPAAQTFSILVGDSNSVQAGCSVQVTVTSSPPPPALTCQVTASPSNPEVNQPTIFQFSASGGQGADTFSGLTVGASGTVTSVLQATSASTASATVVYSSAGMKSLTAVVTDAGGHSASCSKSISVRAPRVTIALNPANGTAPSTGSITATVTTSGFAAGATPILYFYTSEQGVRIVQNGSTATVTDTDGGPHDFILTVAAVDPNNGNDIATGFKRLIFTSNQAGLGCTTTLTARGGTLYPVLPFYYYYYTAEANVSNSSSAQHPRVTRIDVDGSTYAAYTENPLKLAVYFFNSRILEPSQKTVTVELTVTDDTGRLTTCETTGLVWAY